MKPLTAAWVGAVDRLRAGADHVAGRVARIAHRTRLVGVEIAELRRGRGRDLFGGRAARERVAGAARRQQRERGVAGAQRAGFGERGHERGIPRGDPLDEPPAVGHELAAVDPHVAVELDAPQLVVHPLGQVLDAAGVNACAAGAVAAGRLQPLALRRPGHVGERPDSPAGEELVGDHARPACHSRKIARAALAGAAGSGASPAIRPSRSIVLRNCST